MNFYYYKYRKYKHKLNDPLLDNQLWMDVVVDMGKKVQIMGVAEATHGQNRITQWRVSLFKQLVMYAGYTVFVLEDQYSCCQFINDYIHSKTNYPLHLLLNNLEWYWRSQSMFHLIEWMKHYNVTHGANLTFVGIDIQRLCSNNTNQKMQRFVHQKYLKNETINQDDWVQADGFRDQSMFEVFMKIYDKHQKYFLYAHNYHIAKKDIVGLVQNEVSNEGRFIKVGDTIDWLGCLLKKRFGDNYCAIGNIFESGDYLETIDLVDEMENVIYHPYRNSNTYIVVANIPKVGQINVKTYPEGLSTVSTGEFDRVIKLSNEIPLHIIE